MRVEITDGGALAAGFIGRNRGDCVARSVAVASGRPYQDVYLGLHDAAKGERRGKRKRGISNPSSGVYGKTARRYIESIGGVWTPTMGIGTGCRVHMKASELPAGRLVVSLSKHYSAVIDGVVHDTHDCTREGTRCVYGYYTFPEAR